MNRRSAVADCGPRIHERREFLDFDLDKIHDVFGLFLAAGDHGRDGLADEADASVCERRLRHRDVTELVKHGPDRLHAGHVGDGEDGRALRSLHAPDPARRHRTSHEAHPAFCWKVRSETSETRNERGIFNAPDRSSDPGGVV